jgi:hypothetical protein
VWRDRVAYEAWRDGIAANTKREAEEELIALATATPSEAKYIQWKYENERLRRLHAGTPPSGTRLEWEWNNDLILEEGEQWEWRFPTFFPTYHTIGHEASDEFLWGALVPGGLIALAVFLHLGWRKTDG